MNSRGAWWSLEGGGVRVLAWLVIACACAPTLYLRFLPMTDLPQYAALSRMLWHLHDARYGFEPYYELALAKGPACLALYLWGALGDVLSHDAATRLMACLSVACYPLGLAALLRTLGKPSALVLLGLPVLYASPFFLGLVPSSLSTGMAWFVIALLCSERSDRRARASLCALCVALPLTHPCGVVIACGFVASAAVSVRRSERQLPWLWLSPLFAGAVYWGVAALHADGVAAFNYPSLLFRLLRLPEQVLGGFVGRGEALLLGAQLVLWLLCCRGSVPLGAPPFRALPQAERALWSFTALCVLGFLGLPASTWTTNAIHVRAGALAFALLPALVPLANARALRERGPALLLALGIWSAGYANAQLIRFDAEAKPFAAVLARVPARPYLVSLIYDNQGHVGARNPYLHFGAYAQAERGGFLSLSLADTTWTVPVRRRHGAFIPPASYGAEWNPALLQVQPLYFQFYSAVLVNAKEPREMTILMQPNLPYRMLARSGTWLLYARQWSSELAPVTR